MPTADILAPVFHAATVDNDTRPVDEYVVVDGVSAFLGNDWIPGVVDSEEQVRRIQRCAAEIAGGMMSMFPLCKTVPGRTGLLRGAGNAIVPEVGAEFITSYLESERGQRE